MFNPRSNRDMEPMMGIPIKQVTPLRNRTPTPIQTMPLKMMINKQNNVKNVQNAQGEYNTDKPTWFNQQKTKKPLISPVRNPFKQPTQTLPLNGINRNIQINGNQNNQNYKSAQNIQKNTGRDGRDNYNSNNTNNQTCSNHLNKSAEYITYIDDTIVHYCSKCAAQLASQGFEVNKMQPGTVKKGDNIMSGRGALVNNHNSKTGSNSSKYSKKQLPRYPEYQDNRMYQMILDFLNELSTVEQEHVQNMEKLQNIDEHYKEQVESTQGFYEQLLGVIEQMRDDHLADLEEENKKHSQISAIEHDYLRQNVDQMDSIRSDIEENLETIVEKLEEEDLNINLNHYRQKIQVYRHKTEEQSDFFDQVINHSPQEIKEKLNNVQNYLMEIWNDKINQYGNQTEENQWKQPKAQRIYREQQFRNNTHSNGVNKAGKSEGVQPAFRRLFEEQDQLLAETSPQFKKI